MKLFEVSKYLILTGHTYQVYISMINDNFWKKLDPRAQVILEKAAKETGLYQYEISKADNAAARAELEKLGMKFIEVNVSDFQNAVLPVTEKYAAKIEGGLEFLEAVRNTK
jgi:TRAP-type C4-dicarboxylate transport system substrate-binding protein